MRYNFTISEIMIHITLIVFGGNCLWGKGERQMQVAKEREYNMDYLRVACCFLIVLLHFLPVIGTACRLILILFR